jgi:hypothetical protein
MAIEVLSVSFIFGTDYLEYEERERIVEENCFWINANAGFN